MLNRRLLIYKTRYIIRRIAIKLTSKTKEEYLRRKGDDKAMLILSYLEQYNNAVKNYNHRTFSDSAQKEEKIFSIWLQGKEKAPEIVKACWASIKANCSNELVILDEEILGEWISIPERIIKKWKDGKIRHAHFTDVCRVELLYKYGGIWFDSTCFVNSGIPDWVIQQDFFVYLSGDSFIPGYYSFIQNCFIRAQKNSYLLGAWRNIILEYWKNEDKAIDYFIHQLLFKKVVEKDPKATEAFNKMPHIDQEPTHVLWYGYGDKPFDREILGKLTDGIIFQKTEYLSKMSQSPIPGSFADAIMKMYK